MNRDRTMLVPFTRLAVLSVVLAITCLPAAGQGIITTLGGCSPAPANLCAQTNTAVDAAGNIYFGTGYQIAMMDPSGMVTAIAGAGQRGTSGDGGPALSATLGLFHQIALSGSRLCFGDNVADKIRCVDLSTGLIQGYGTGLSGTGGDGGNVSAASFMGLWGVAFDNQGILYVADMAASSVRRVDFTTGIITMFAGPGPGASGEPLGDGGPALGANIYEPEGLTFGNGTIYIADAGNLRIRGVNLATGLISTVAGNGSAFYLSGSEGGSALQAGMVPRWITLDTAGNLFLGSSCCTIRQVDTAGIITTVAGASGNEGIGLDDIPATQTTFVTILGLGWDPVATRLLITDYSGRLRQIFYTPPTATTLTASENPAHWGDTVTLTAVVAPPDATGSVRFYSGYPSSQAGLLGSSPISNGSATGSWTAPVGDASYTLYAVYGGDFTHNLSGSTLAEVVKSGSSSTGLSSSVNPSLAGQSVTFTATVGPVGVSGTVTFLNNGIALGSSPVVLGIATLTLSNLPSGSNSITAYYSGDSRYVGSTSPAVIQVVSKASTTTVLYSSANPSVYGGSVVLGAIVSLPGATGTVQFLEGATLLGTATINSKAEADLSLSNLSVGTHSIIAIYSGDANDQASTSAALAQVVNQASSTITLASSANPSTVGQSVTLTAVLSPAFATGTVQFLDGATLLGTVAIASGSAVLAVPSLAVGGHSLTAVYSGDGNDTSSTSALLKQLVNKVASNVVLMSSQNPSFYGTNIPLSATVTPSSASGSVQFLDGTTLLGTATISGGSATIYVSTLLVGSHAITAVYGGDANDEGSTSAAVTQTVNMDASTVTVASSLNPSAFGQPVTFSATVTPSAATGTVQFLDGSTVLGTATVGKAMASLSLSSLTAGTHAISAAYSGDGNDTASTSAILAQTVNKVASSVVLTSSQNPALSGTNIQLSAAVTPSSATGSVQLLDGSTPLGTAVISGGSATVNISTLTAGSHTIAAVYGGDANDAGSTSAILTQTVKAISSLSLVSSVNPSAYGQTVTFTVTVSPGSATGTVQVRDGSATLGTVTLNGGSAALPVSGLAPGSHYVIGLYNGDANTAASVSPVLTQTVAPPAPSHLTATTVSNSEIDLSWQTVVTSGVLYNVYVSTVPILKPSPTNLYGGYPAPPLKILSLQPATTYYFLVTAVLSGGESAPANPASATTLPATVVVLTSSRNPSTEGQAVTFRAKVSPAAATGTVQFMDGSTTFATVPLAGGVASATISTLSAGGHSIYAAYSGNVQYGPITVVMAQDVFPDPPSHLTAVAVSPTQINLSWQASPTSGVTYNVYSSAIPGFTPSASSIIAAGLSTTTFSDGSLPPSTTRYYLVCAAIPTGQSASNQASAKTLPVAAPSRLTATAVSTSQIDLSWQASPTSGVAYNVYSSATSGFRPSASNLIASGVTTTSYFDTGLAPSTTRYYLVTAALSGAESASSNQASAKTAHR